MSAKLLVVPATLGAGVPVARVSCGECGAVLHFDVESERLRRLVAALSRVHVCAAVAS